MTYDPARAYACTRCRWPLWPTTPIDAVLAHYAAEHPDATEVEFEVTVSSVEAVPRGGLGDLGYGARRELRLFLDRELSDQLDAAAARADVPPEVWALRALARALNT